MMIRPLSQHADGQEDLEMWGGVECTLNRVGDQYFDQLTRTRHPERLDDFALFKGLGINTLRHGVLWERTAPDGLESADWSWPDLSLGRLCDLGIRPIVGLLHHGSGPLSTSLLDPQFPEKLAAFAECVAERYPFVQDYTPVNEPLTTARFSALYGFWYPHAHDDLSFVKALVNQCRGIVLAMRAIRRVNSDARLVQTEDLGTVFSTPYLSYQAEFENERRWSSFDLLCGRVTREHPMWSYFRSVGLSVREIEWFSENPCPPDVLGINHYLSSDRYLDEHVQRYPPATHGGNGSDRYADVLASRVLNDWTPGVQSLLRSVWERYGRPTAITECHNGCTREEQMRWLWEVWQAARRTRESGAQVVAVTAWALLGSFDWNTLVTQSRGHYEPGVFDMRSQRPRPTAVSRLVGALARHEHYDNPVLDCEGWWRRNIRFIYGFAVDDSGEKVKTSKRVSVPPSPVLRWNRQRPLLITGARGTLAQAFARLCDARGIPFSILPRSECDIADSVSVRSALSLVRPWAVVNAAGYVDVDGAELNPERCYRENTEGPAVLAEQCALAGIKLLAFSSDLVFNGLKSGPYVESDPVNALNQYGRAKVEMERRLRDLLPSALIVRTSAFFGPWDDFNFLTIALRALSADVEFTAANDLIVSPTYVPDLVEMSLDLLMDGERGLWHLANQGQISWADFAQRAAQLAGVPTERLRRCSLDNCDFIAPRPRSSVLGSERGRLLPSLDNALERFVADHTQSWNLEALAA
jgi:dTDP-4-dehydrorhamnose reductase